MKRYIRSSELTDFEVIVNFGGYIGADEPYTVTAKSIEEAEEKAVTFAKEDLTVEDICQNDEDEWVVTIGFCGMIGVENDYEVYADSEEEAELTALQEAEWDLTPEVQ